MQDGNSGKQSGKNFGPKSQFPKGDRREAWDLAIPGLLTGHEAGTKLRQNTLSAVLLASQASSATRARPIITLVSCRIVWVKSILRALTSGTGKQDSARHGAAAA